MGLTASVAAVLFFELFLQHSPFSYNVSPVRYDSQIGMWHKENFTNYIVQECYKTKYIFDSAGLPSSVAKYDANKQDVIILGDSYVEALMVHNKNVIHNSLGRVFDGKYNFLNYALSGSSPTQQFVILKDKVDLTNAKYVLQFISIEGDLLDVDSKNLSSLARPKVYVEFDSLDKYKIIPPRAKRLIDDIGDFLGNYQTYSFIKKLLYHLKDNLFRRGANDLIQSTTPKQENDLSKNWLYLKGAIYQINQSVQETSQNIHYKLVITSSNEDNKNMLQKFLNEQNIEFIFLDNIAQDMNISLAGYECDSHWNDKTHNNIAHIIQESRLVQ